MNLKKFEDPICEIPLHERSSFPTKNW
jgi:hypothetical protein